jgi:hypothetical protein
MSRRWPQPSLVVNVELAARAPGAACAVSTLTFSRRHSCELADPTFNVEQPSGCHRMPVDELPLATVATPPLCMVSGGHAAVAGAMVRGEPS